MKKLVTLIFLIFFPATLSAQVTVDVEIDPIAYALSGQSVHAGLWVDQFRFDVGAFGLKVPEFLHGQEDLEQRFSGFGLKADYVFRDDRKGFFVGIEGGLSRAYYTDPAIDLTVERLIPQAGIRGGYRIHVWSDIYVIPWVGVGRQFSDTEIAVGDKTFEQSAWTFFPTIHIAYAPR